jgi:hypothetical protein
MTRGMASGRWCSPLTGRAGPPPSASLNFMSTHPTEGATPLLDEWIAEVGEDEVISAVRTAMHAIEDGTIPGFTDKQAMLAYIGRHASR